VRASPKSKQEHGLQSKASRHISLNLLGGCALTIDDRLVAGVTASFFRIVAYIVLSGIHGTVPRRRIGALLWSDADDGKAAANLRQALARIRHMQQEHGFSLLESNHSTIYVVPNHNVRCDLIEVNQHLSGKRGTAVELCDIYGGELLADLDESGDGFEDWLTIQRDQLHTEFVDRMTAAIAPDSALTHADRAICAHRLLTTDPYSEEAYRCLMREAAEHRQIARLHYLYDTIRALLAEELGVPPAVETEKLYHQLLRTMMV
jgi:DNA-binding SARP family transcriptional activator